MNEQGLEKEESLLREGGKEKAEELFEKADERLNQRESPLGPTVLEVLRETKNIIFSPEAPGNQGEQEVMLTLLGLLAYNNWPSGEKENGVLKDSGGIQIEGHWRVNRERQDFLILESNGRLSLEEGKKEPMVNQFLKRIGIAGDCIKNIKACLRKGQGPRLLVYTDKLGVILNTILGKGGAKLILRSPAFRERSVIKTNAPFNSFRELITATVYPPQVEMIFGED
jgi:hypothetical protein